MFDHGGTNPVARESSATFDEHERPTAPRSRLEEDVDPNATTRLKPFELEELVQKGSGTRPVVTAEQIDRYMKERTVVLDERLTEPLPKSAPATTTDDQTGPQPRLVLPADVEATAKADANVDIRDRETVDALTLQRETLIIKPADNVPPTGQQIPIDVDLSRLSQMPTPRPAAGQPVPFTARFGTRLDQRQLTIAAAFLIAMVSALIGFIAGRL